MPVCVADALADHQADSLAVFGLRWRLYLQQWRLGALPADLDKLRRLSGASAREWRRCWPEVETEFPLTDSVEFGPNSVRLASELGHFRSEKCKSSVAMRERARNAAFAKYAQKPQIAPASSSPASSPASIPTEHNITEQNRGATPTPSQQKMFPGERMKLLEELRDQRERLINRYGRDVNRRIVLPPEHQGEADRLAARIKQLEGEL
jgi:hypothetical protein